jgi:hypothetical protein
VQESFVYKIPPLKNESGHRANDWDVNKWLWSGRLRIAARGNELTIYLEDAETGALFAACPVREPGSGASSVDAVTDSSRYFVLRIEDGKGHHQYIGMGFRERPDSYDFNATLLDHWKGVRREREATEMCQQLEANPQTGPQLDLKLKEGQMLSINLGQKTRERVAANRRPSGGDLSSALRALAPPPPSLPSPPPVRPPPAASSAGSDASTTPPVARLSSDDFGDFDDGTSGGGALDDDDGFATFQAAPAIAAADS